MQLVKKILNSSQERSSSLLFSTRRVLFDRAEHLNRASCRADIARGSFKALKNSARCSSLLGWRFLQEMDNPQSWQNTRATISRIIQTPRLSIECSHRCLFYIGAHCCDHPRSMSTLPSERAAQGFKPKNQPEKCKNLEIVPAGGLLG